MAEGFGLIAELNEVKRKVTQKVYEAKNDVYIARQILSDQELTTEMREKVLALLGQATQTLDQIAL